MRFFFDTEFIEDGKTIDLMSIGIVSEGYGHEYYAENSECDLSRACPWVQANVIPHLIGGEARKPRAQIAKEIVEFVGKDPEFWGYFADYDWVVLCQLYGRMVDLPATWPMFCLDVKQMSKQLNLGLQPHTGTIHNALEDARWTRDCWDSMDLKLWLETL